MANKTFNTRVKNKRDTAANWEAVATTFQPLDGELIIVDTAAGKTRFKVGRYDTAKGRLLYYNEIPFTDEYLYNDLNESQGKIYDKLKGIDDKSIIEMTLESVFDNTKFVNYRIGLWQFGKTGFYKLNIPKRGTTATQLFLYAQKIKEDGTTPEDPFSQDNLLRISPLTGDKQVESVFVQVDYTDTDTLTVYKVQFLNVITFPGTININTYNKTTQKWDFTSVTESSAKWANNATQVSNVLTLTKGDTTTKFDGSTAQTVEIPTKTSELTNDSFVSYTEQTLTEDQQNQAKTNLGIDVLTGNTTAITPTQVKEAILNGRPVSITYTDTTYGNLTFTSFGYSVENNVVVANLVSISNGQYILADLVGMSNNDQWTLQTTELGTSTDIDNLILNIANSYVKYSESQTLTDEQKATARTNIGAISEAELAQPDWNQNDTIAKDYIKNRICYEEETVTELGNTVEVWVSLVGEEASTSVWKLIDIPISYKIKGILYENQKPSKMENYVMYYGERYGENPEYVMINTYSPHNMSFNGMETSDFQFVKVENTVKQIDKKYIPDEAFTQANWNENNEASPAYIQNRICYEETVPDTYEELRLTTSNWKSLTGYVKGSDLSKMLSIPLDFIVNGVKHYNVFPEWYFESKTEIAYFFNESKTVYVSVEENDIDINGVSLGWSSSSSNNISFLKIIKHENLVKQIDSKYIPIDSTPTEGSTNAASSGALAKLAGNIDVFVNRLPEFAVIVTLDQSEIFTDDQKQVARNNIGIKDPFKVTFTRSYGKVSADKTAKEIKDAANNGQFVYGMFSGDFANIYTLSISNQNDIRFNRLYTETDSNMGLCYNVFYINNPTDDFKGDYEETYCCNITAPSIKVVKVMLDNGTYKFDSTGVATSYNEIFNICKTSNGNNYTNSDVFISYGGNKLYKLDQNPWSASNPLVFKRVSYDSTTSSILFETFTVNTDSTITYESNVFEQNSTQSDWNQTDTSASDYIKNKPTIDTALSSTSENAIQNKAVKTAIDSLQTAVDSKVDTTALNYGLTQVANDVAANYVKFTAEQTLTDEQKAQARDNINAPSPADAVYTVTASSTDGVAYTATVSGIDSLTVGASFIMIPNKASTSKAPTLNVNGLGAKPIRRRLSSLTTSLQQGYSTNWIALNKPFTVVYDGTAWVIEGLTKTDGADVYGAVAQATADAKGNNIADTYATIAMLQSLLPKVTTITLTSNWVGDASPYYQDIALSCVTETSIVDLQPTPEQLNSWQDDGLAFTTLSGNGTVRVYVAGGKPSSAISVQVRVQEVTVI